MKHLHIHFGDSLSFIWGEFSHNSPEKQIIGIEIYNCQSHGIWQGRGLWQFISFDQTVHQNVFKYWSCKDLKKMNKVIFYYLKVV